MYSNPRAQIRACMDLVSQIRTCIDLVLNLISISNQLKKKTVNYNLLIIVRIKEWILYFLHLRRHARTESIHSVSSKWSRELRWPLAPCIVQCAQMRMHITLILILFPTVTDFRRFERVWSLDRMTNVTELGIRKRKANLLRFPSVKSR